MNRVFIVMLFDQDQEVPNRVIQTLLFRVKFEVLKESSVEVPNPNGVLHSSKRSKWL